MQKFTPEWYASLPVHQLGAEIERQVEEYFDYLNQLTRFSYLRFPDSKAARNIIKAQPADYLVASDELAAFVEVKAVGHEFRLKSSSIRQLPLLRKWDNTVCQGLVLSFHYSILLWRVTPSASLDPCKSSHDLSGSAGKLTIKEAMAPYFGALHKDLDRLQTNPEYGAVPSKWPLP